MATADPDAEPIITRQAAIRAAERTVASAFATEFSIDPVIGRDLSRSFSVVNSVVKRHGPLIARTLADTLRATGKFDVFTEMVVAVPPAADDLLEELADCPRPDSIARGLLHGATGNR